MLERNCHPSTVAFVSFKDLSVNPLVLVSIGAYAENVLTSIPSSELTLSLTIIKPSGGVVSKITSAEGYDNSLLKISVSSVKKVLSFPILLVPESNELFQSIASKYSGSYSLTLLVISTALKALIEVVSVSVKLPLKYLIVTVSEELIFTYVLSLTVDCSTSEPVGFNTTADFTLTITSFT